MKELHDEQSYLVNLARFVLSPAISLHSQVEDPSEQDNESLPVYFRVCPTT